MKRFDVNAWLKTNEWTYKCERWGQRIRERESKRTKKWIDCFDMYFVGFYSNEK